MKDAGFLVVLLAIAVLLRAPALGGPGYALDEEITVFAVRGIQQVGLPLLPSGVVSDRGLPYSYAAWITGVAFGQTLLSYRLVSLFRSARRRRSTADPNSVEPLCCSPRREG